MHNNERIKIEQVRMNGRLPNSCGFLQMKKSGAFEIELYDYSERAQSWFGNDVAIIYAVKPEACPSLIALLNSDCFDTPQERSQSPASSHNTALPQLCATAFEDVDACIEWLKASGVPYHQTFDSDV